LIHNPSWVPAAYPGTISGSLAYGGEATVTQRVPGAIRSTSATIYFLFTPGSGPKPETLRPVLAWEAESGKTCP
jgi:hypothetical protein